MDEALQILDEQEAAYQQEKARKIINRANNMMYQGDQRVKEMHSAVVLSATLKEREAQMAMNRRKRQMKAEAEAQEAELIRDQHSRALQRELDEQKMNRMMSAEQRRINQEQFTHLAERKRVERFEEMREAETMRQAVAQTNAELEEQRLQRQEAIKKSARENASALKAQQQARIDKARLDALEEHKIEEQAKERENLEHKRRAFEMERAAARQAVLTEQAQRLFDSLTIKESREQERVEREQARIAAQFEEKERQLAERKKKLQEETLRVRSQQLARKRVTKQAEAEAAARVNAQWAESIARLEEEEKIVAELEKQQTAAVKRENLRRAALSREKEYAEAERELQESAEYKRRLAEDTAVYEDWVDRHLQEARAKARPLVPIYKTLDMQRDREAGLVLGAAMPKRGSLAPTKPQANAKGSP